MTRGPTLTSKPFLENRLRKAGFIPLSEIVAAVQPLISGLVTRAALADFATVGLIEMAPYSELPGSGSFVATWWYRIPGWGTIPAGRLYEELRSAHDAITRLKGQDE